MLPSLWYFIMAGQENEYMRTYYDQMTGLNYVQVWRCRRFVCFNIFPPNSFSFLKSEYEKFVILNCIDAEGLLAAQKGNDAN